MTSATAAELVWWMGVGGASVIAVATLALALTIASPWSICSTFRRLTAVIPILAGIAVAGAAAVLCSVLTLT